MEKRVLDLEAELVILRTIVADIAGLTDVAELIADKLDAGREVMEANLLHSRHSDRMKDAIDRARRTWVARLRRS